MADERSSKITIGGAEYEMLLTTKATKGIAGRYGGLSNLGEKLMKSENFEMALDEIVSSEVGFRGIFKKVLIFILVGIGHIMDTYLIGNGEVLRTVVIFFYCSNEGVSMLENAGHLGLPIPAKLKDILEQLHDRTEDK